MLKLVPKPYKMGLWRWGGAVSADGMAPLGREGVRLWQAREGRAGQPTFRVTGRWSIS
jgi:hypothetical protein